MLTIMLHWKSLIFIAAADEGAAVDLVLHYFG